MGRTVSAVLTHGPDVLGTAGPFAVTGPWWSDVAPVVAGLTERLGVPVLVLRLLRVEGEGMRDGYVTYHAEALARPAAPLAPADVAYGDLVAPQRFRAPWATTAGLHELLGWARAELAAAGRPMTGPVEQHRTWNLAGLFRLPTASGPVWLKATPHFASDEAAVITAFARHDPGLVPPVLAAGEHRMLLGHVPGGGNVAAPAEVVADMVGRLAAAQAVTAAPPGLPRRHDTPARVRALLDDGVPELTADERAAARRLTGRWPELDACGLPDTLVHGDCHAGNWLGDPPVVIDFADAHVGNPVLDGLRAAEFLPTAAGTAAARAWVRAWTALAPGSDPARALAVAEPLGRLVYAVRYQEFLDGIEPSERVYHAGDPASAIRAALRLAREPSPWVAA
jgi:phosphotransferase family enzyme